MIINEFFAIKEIDKVSLDPNNPKIKVTNKIFSKVSRIFAESKSKKTEIVLDVNSDLFVSKEGDNIELLLKDSPFVDINKKDEKGMVNLEKSLELESMEDYEYVMHGVIFHSGIEEGKIFIYASFGGLLMKYYGQIDNIQIEDIKLDKKILLMLKKY